MRAMKTVKSNVRESLMSIKEDRLNSLQMARPAIRMGDAVVPEAIANKVLTFIALCADGKLQFFAI